MQRPFDPAAEPGRASFPAGERPAPKLPDRGPPPFELPELPYGYGDLEPIIDAETMKLHHDKHHRAYVDGLNEALARHPRLRGSTLKSLLCDRAKVPEDIRPRVHDMGGGHYNHTLFWLSMTPKSGA